MGEQTKIAWCDSTWSPWWGCTKVSPGCAHCYAEAFDKRTGGSHWGPGAERRILSGAHWREPLKWHAAAVERGVRQRVFPSMCDPFDPEAPNGVRFRFWDLIEATTMLDWLLVTKRPEHIPELVPPRWRTAFPANVWLGVSAEDQETAAARIPALLATSAAVRFVSAEPLLESFDVARWLRPRRAGDPPEWRRAVHTPSGPLPGIDWVIIGGESGCGARPFNLGWARALVDQCRAAGTPVFCKQLGALPVVDEDTWRAWSPIRLLSAAKSRRAPPGTVAIELRDPKGGDPAEWPVDLRVQEWPESPFQPRSGAGVEEACRG